MNSIGRKSNAFVNHVKWFSLISNRSFSSVATSPSENTNKSTSNTSSTSVTQRPQLTAYKRLKAGTRTSLKLRQGVKIFHAITPIYFTPIFYIIYIIIKCYIYCIVWIEHKIPGVIYGVDKDKKPVKVLLTLDQKSLEIELRKHGASFENTLYDIRMEDGSTYTVVPRQVQFNPCTTLMSFTDIYII